MEKSNRILILGLIVVALMSLLVLVAQKKQQKDGDEIQVTPQNVQVSEEETVMMENESSLQKDAAVTEEPRIAVAEPVDSSVNSVLGFLEELGNFSTFVAFINMAQVQEIQTMENAYTILAPNDAAFGKLPLEDTQAISNDSAKLKTVVSNHAIVGSMTLEDLKTKKSVTTLAGKTLPVTVSGDGAVTVGSSTIVDQGTPVQTGTVFVVDTVLLP